MRIRALNVVNLAGILLPTICFGGSDYAPKFDQTPVQIPNVQKTSPRAIASRDLLLLRDLHGVQISPDGLQVAFVLGQAVRETNSYRTGLFVVATEPGSKPVSLGTAGPPRWDEINQWIQEPPAWSPNGQFIAYRLRTNGHWQIWRWRRDGSDPVQLTHNASGDVDKFRWNGDGTQIAYSITTPPDDRDAEDLQEKGVLYSGDNSPWLQQSIIQDELQKRVRVQHWIVDVQTRREAVVQNAAEASNAWESAFLDRVSAQTKQVARPSTEVDDVARLSPDGTQVGYFVSGDGSPNPTAGTYSLNVMDIRFQSTRRLVSGKWLSDLSWGVGGHTLYYTENKGDGHRERLFAIDSRGGSPKEIKVRTNAWIDQLSFDDTHSMAACATENNTTPAQVAVIDLRRGVLRVLVDPNPEFGNIWMNPAKRIEWTNEFGEPGYAYVVYPSHYEAVRRYPMVVTTYRSGDYFLRGGVGDEYPVQVMAALGIAVLAFDSGLSPGDTHGNFELAKRRWTSPMASLDAAIKIAEKMGVADVNKLGISGLSTGAEIAIYSMYHSKLFATAVTSGLASQDPYFYYLGGKGWRDMYADMGLEFPEGVPAARWKEVSSALNAVRVSGPFLANTAESEYLGDLQTYAALTFFKKPFEYFIYANEQHVKNQPKHRYEIYERNVDWFRYWLQDYEDPDPAKSDQYTRWRELRKLQQAQDVERASVSKECT